MPLLEFVFGNHLIKVFIIALPKQIDLGGIQLPMHCKHALHISHTVQLAEHVAGVFVIQRDATTRIVAVIGVLQHYRGRGPSPTFIVFHHILAVAQGDYGSLRIHVQIQVESCIIVPLRIIVIRSVLDFHEPKHIPYLGHVVILKTEVIQFVIKSLRQCCRT